MLFRLISLSRTMFSFLSGVYVYVVAWALLGQDSGDNLGPDNLKDFAVSRITGRAICCLIFPKKKNSVIFSFDHQCFDGIRRLHSNLKSLLVWAARTAILSHHVFGRY